MAYLNENQWLEIQRRFRLNFNYNLASERELFFELIKDKTEFCSTRNTFIEEVNTFIKDLLSKKHRSRELHRQLLEEFIDVYETVKKDTIKSELNLPPVGYNLDSSRRRSEYYNSAQMRARMASSSRPSVEQIAEDLNVSKSTLEKDLQSHNIESDGSLFLEVTFQCNIQEMVNILCDLWLVIISLPTKLRKAREMTLLNIWKSLSQTEYQLERITPELHRRRESNLLFFLQNEQVLNATFKQTEIEMIMTMMDKVEDNPNYYKAEGDMIEKVYLAYLKRGLKEKTVKVRTRDNTDYDEGTIVQLNPEFFELKLPYKKEKRIYLKELTEFQIKLNP